MGNEFSYYMLLAASFMLNCTERPEQARSSIPSLCPQLRRHPQLLLLLGCLALGLAGLPALPISANLSLPCCGVCPACARPVPGLRSRLRLGRCGPWHGPWTSRVRHLTLEPALLCSGRCTLGCTAAATRCPTPSSCARCSCQTRTRPTWWQVRPAFSWGRGITVGRARRSWRLPGSSGSLDARTERHRHCTLTAVGPRPLPALRVARAARCRCRMRVPRMLRPARGCAHHAPHRPWHAQHVCGRL